MALQQEMAASNVAIVEAFYPGTRGSEAIAAALFAAAPLEISIADNVASGASGSASTRAAASAGGSRGVYVDRWGRMPYSMYSAEWVGLSPMDEMDLASGPGRTYRSVRSSPLYALAK